MKRPDFIELFARHRGKTVTITGPGLATRILFAFTGDDPTILYNMEMPYATPLSMGLAMARPGERFVALEGDGSLISALGVLTTLGRYRPQNLTVVVLDNESYSSFGKSTPSATAHGVDLAALARGCGIETTITVRTLAEAESALPKVLTEPGLWMLVAKLDAEEDDDPRFARGSPDVGEQALDFRRMLRRRAGA